MQTHNVLIITLLVNILIVGSTNVDRPKRDLAFIKRIIASLFGYNTNNEIMSNINILYPVPSYRVLMNAMPDPYMNQNIYQGSLSKILIPSNMVMQPVFHYERSNIPYIMPYDERNYETAYPNFHSSQIYGNTQRVIPIPSYNRFEVPIVRCNDETPVSYRKDVTKDKTGEESSELQTFRDREEISKEGKAQRSSQPPQPVNIIITSTTTPRVPKRKIQRIRTTTTTSSTNLEVTTKPFSFYDPITSAKEQISSSTLPTYFSKVQELTTYAITRGPTLTTPRPPPPLTVKNVQKIEILEQTTPPIKNRDEVIKSTSTTRTPTSDADYKQPHKKVEINDNFNPYIASKKIVTFTEPIRTRFIYKRVNSNKPNEDKVFKMEDIKYPNVNESQDDLAAQPSMVNNVIDVLNSIAPIRGKVLNPLKVFTPQEIDDTLEEINSDYMEINSQSTDVYPSESEELDYLNRAPIIIDEPSHGSVPEEVSHNMLNESEEGFRWMMPSDFATEISRGDIPDV